jgi:GAF domain-containing protein
VIRLADLLESTRLSRLVEHGYDYELSHLHPDSGDRVVFARSSVVALEAPLLFNIDVPNARWTLALAPHQGWRTLGALLADSVLVLLSSLLIAGLTYALARQPELLRRQVELRTQELAHIVHELTQEILERQSAEQALAERNTQLEVIRTIGQEITRQLDLTALLTLITRRAMELVGAAGGAIYLRDDAAQVLMPRAWYSMGDWLQDVCIRLGESVAGAVAQSRQGLQLNDYRNWSQANPLFLERTGTTAILAEPLLDHGQLLGVITLNNDPTEQPFAQQALDRLALLADQAAIAIQNARLYEHQEVRAARLQTLMRLNQPISASLEMDAVLQEIAHAAATLMNVPLVRIWSADDATQTLELQASCGNSLAGAHLGRTLRLRCWIS